MSNVDKQIIIEMSLLFIVWGGGVIFVVYQSLRRQNIDLWNLLNPLVIFVLKGRDFLYLLGVLLLAFGTLKVYWVLMKFV